MLRWLKLKKIAEEITKESVDIHITTQLKENIRGVCTRNMQTNGVEILLNAKYAKKEDDVIETLAHELAHLKVKGHGKSFQKEMDRIKELIKKGLKDGNIDK
ncbi:SprT-like domain-containing protein [bacterium]|nr:SprT-like domain-containing protein [bacterium]